MYIKKLLFLICFFPVLLFSQNTGSIAGFWEGTITQDINGIRTNYKMEVTLIQNGNKITGRSKVYFEDKYAIMSLEGQFNSKASFFKYHEIEMLDFKAIPGSDWCIKRGELILKKKDNFWILEGLWEGDAPSGTCDPGRVYLKRGLIRA